MTSRPSLHLHSASDDGGLGNVVRLFSVQKRIYLFHAVFHVCISLFWLCILASQFPGSSITGRYGDVYPTDTCLRHVSAYLRRTYCRQHGSSAASTREESRGTKCEQGREYRT